MATTPRKRAETATAPPTNRAARRTAKKVAAPAATFSGDFEPVRLSTKDEAPKIERVPVFYIDDKMYGVPVEVPPNLALQFLNIINTEEDDERALPLAVAMAFDGLFGEGALKELAACKALTQPQLDQIMGFVQTKMFSATEKMTGN
jgi:hypothetical protein